MARYQCISCEAIQTTGDNEPDACRDCGGPVFDLDRYEASRAEAQIIGAQNDLFRTALGPADWNGQVLRGRVVVTRGILALGPDFVAAALTLTRSDTTFMDEQGRYGARSFGMPDVPHEDHAIRIYLSTAA